MRLFAPAVAVLLLLSSCGSSSTNEPVAWRFDPTADASTPETIPARQDTPGTVTTATPPPVFTATPTGNLAQLVPLTPEELKATQPNELGLIPILEYHVITTNPEEEEQFTRPKEKMIADLQWLYDHNFYVIPLRDVIENRITAPAGKHPVVLTFDDATSFQFGATVDASGNLVPDPDTAVGILENFFASHPDFGHTGHFTIVPNNCFAFPDESQMPLCHDKLKWLQDHGYEIGNHTWTHADLYDVDDETFMKEIGETKLFIDKYVSGPANMSDVLTLPFGDYPDKETRHNQRVMMREGFEYKGETIKLKAALMVGANPTESPNSNEWDPIFMARVQAFDESLDFWFDAYLDGSVVYYTSDGNPDIVTLPDPLPSYVTHQYDYGQIKSWRLEMVKYDPETGEITKNTADKSKDRHRSDTDDDPDEKHRKRDG